MTLRLFVALGLFFMLATVLTASPPSLALGLKVAPLEYRATLKKDEIKKGFIDVSNPSKEAVNLHISTQAFRQIDNSGGLQFYDDKAVSAGIKTDITDIELGPREALRLYFTINSSILPKGDVYAAIFFTTDPVRAKSGVGQLVRVGTLLSLVNQNPGARSAAVTNLSIPFVQFDDTVQGSYGVKNTGPSSSGFFPEVAVTSWPANKSRHIGSSLVFGGRERQNDFNYQLGYGIHYLTVSYQASKQGQWVITVAPWMLITCGMLGVVIGIEVALLRKRRRNRT